MSEHPYTPFLHKVEKPARYVGGEFNTIVKEWSDVDCRMALCFPDLYDIGMSHLGTKILYSVINKSDDLCVERVFCPWLDMEAQLRLHNEPLRSLETHRPLRDFDVVGFSLQYELTFTNILTMLDLGGVPLHTHERTLDDPFVIAGGPVATHPEPMAPFLDIIMVGDGEERLPRLMRHIAEMKQEGTLSRTEMLIEIAKEGGVYCPELYTRSTCERSGFLVVDGPKYEGVPEIVERAFLDDISRYKFPDDSPVAVAEAIFDRMSIEIARGCTEGCRFCQAGMIYRPVRERDPEEVIDTVMSALDKSGYNEAAITSLSTADYSCISPLVKKLMARLRPKKVGLGISSLRAYGLEEDLLDEIESVKATGLTFAPEAGTQRMRDVINKNITEDDIYATCHRVFARNWNKCKLYFIIGLPTEEDEDVIGIAKMGRQAVEIGKLYKNKVNVVVSVSSHVPKPHTPFQWCAQDSREQLAEKQDMLHNLSRKWGFKFRHHEIRVSYIEGIIARGDIRAGELLLDVWKRGARFDGWDEHLAWNEWQEAIEAWETKHDFSRQMFLGTIPLDARLPWDHIDVGLDEGFLEKEYQKALKSRLSPPCGKPLGAKIHHTNLEDAHAESKKLVCYHCGIACDLGQMKQERLTFLDKLGAETRPEKREGPSSHETAMSRMKQGKTPHDFQQGERHRYRIQFTKLAPIHMQSHHDLLRIVPRILRRAKLPIYHSEGFNPRPMLTFGPALSLGVQSLAEYVDISLTEAKTKEEILEALRSQTPDGLYVTGVRVIGHQDPSLSKILRQVEYLVVPSQEALRDVIPEDTGIDLTSQMDIRRHFDTLAQQAMASEELPVTVTRKKTKVKTVNLRPQLVELDVTTAALLPPESGLHGEQTAFRMTLKEGDGPVIRPAEVMEALFGVHVELHHVVRLGCWASQDGVQVSPLLFVKKDNEPDTLMLPLAEAKATSRGNVQRANELMEQLNTYAENKQSEEPTLSA
jgi:radical SAM family uncharacterized protein/radical SAM-linked protein